MALGEVLVQPVLEAQPVLEEAQGPGEARGREGLVMQGLKRGLQNLDDFQRASQP